MFPDSFFSVLSVVLSVLAVVAPAASIALVIMFLPRMRIPMIILSAIAVILVFGFAIGWMFTTWYIVGSLLGLAAIYILMIWIFGVVAGLGFQRERSPRYH